MTGMSESGIHSPWRHGFPDFRWKLGMAPRMTATRAGRAGFGFAFLLTLETVDRLFVVLAAFRGIVIVVVVVVVVVCFVLADQWPGANRHDRLTGSGRGSATHGAPANLDACCPGWPKYLSAPLVVLAGSLTH
jgi:fatty acid desaturase